ncbi:MAG TPA: ParA family protein [Jiangellaceae bacterium]|nr:ParA family protein [Jiangellaceae bacterium]
MLTISVLSLKGGVGKTSVTLGLAGAAQHRATRTLVIDLDPQANATTALDPAVIKFTVNDLLSDGRGISAADAVTTSGWGPGVALLAGEPAVAHRDDPAEGKGTRRLRTALAGTEGFDLTLVDCPPSLSELTRNALAASDLALVVTEPTIFAVTGAQQALAAVDVVRKAFNLRLRPAGIVVNRTRLRSAEHRFRIDELIAAYRDLVLDPVLPERSAISQAQGSCLPVQRWPTPGAREVSRIFAIYLNHLLTTARTDGPLTRGSS